MAKEHTIACGITQVPRVFVKRGDSKYRQNAAVFVGGVRLGEVYEAPVLPGRTRPAGEKWTAENFFNPKARLSRHKTAAAAVKALVCGQIRSERTSRKLPY